MGSHVEFAKLIHMEAIKKHVCPDCGSILERAASPGSADSFGCAKGDYEYWDFYCVNEKCGKVWRVPRIRYEAAFGEWPE